MERRFCHFLFLQLNSYESHVCHTKRISFLFVLFFGSIAHLYLKKFCKIDQYFTEISINISKHILLPDLFSLSAAKFQRTLYFSAIKP